MDSDIHNRHHNQQQPPHQNLNSGLTRYRSAPSSYFSNLINSGMYGNEDLDPFFSPPISSPESERILSRFCSDQIQGNEFMKQEQQQMIFQNHAPSQESMGPPTNLLRQSSSPAGFFEHHNIDNGYTMMRSMDNFSSSSRLLSRIPEHEGKPTAHSNGGFWDESTMLTDGFLNEFTENDQISSSENREKLNDEGRIQSIRPPTGLTHQLSLPTSSTELSVKEKLLQFQENVPLRSRAKRGCATHPRSIAERVRRTRISERMRKLQDLVPNMDKQTSTADMLDLAVDYIKELQNQVKTLSDCRTKCKCQNKLKL